MRSDRPKKSRHPAWNAIGFVAVVVAVVAGGNELLPKGQAATPTAARSTPGVTAPAQPSASSAPAAVPVPAAGPSTTAASVPAGTLFDDFSYSGPDDPSLGAHGWQARTQAGGPGIQDTWSTAGVSFPAVADAQGGRALQLQVVTDGTTAGTKQAELVSSGADFFTGTYAARIYFNDQPTSGQGGDHIVQAFYANSTSEKSSLYSELDNEYMPDGGWGAPGPALDTTSWYDASKPDRVTHRSHSSLQGWHTVMITAVNGTVVYSIDGQKVFTSQGRYFPRESMGIHFNAWLIDLPFTGAPRTWDMRVNWVYYQTGQAKSLTEVQKTVQGYYAKGTHYVNTPAKP